MPIYIRRCVKGAVACLISVVASVPSDAFIALRPMRQLRQCVGEKYINDRY